MFVAFLYSLSIYVILERHAPHASTCDFGKYRIVEHQRLRRLRKCVDSPEALQLSHNTFGLGPSIKGLVTGGNTNLCCRGFVLALFQSTTANKIDSEHTGDYTEVIPGMQS